ncbi:kinase-like domain-containing protein [Mycena vulgaris]|nr:kinase-like domain-containing protein [Mycena vulgaris]
MESPKTTPNPPMRPFVTDSLDHLNSTWIRAGSAANHAVAQHPKAQSIPESPKMHGGPWLEIHRNLASHVFLMARNHSRNKLLELSKEWAEWSIFTSLANYHSVMDILFSYLDTKVNSSDSRRASVTEISDRLSGDVSTILRHMVSVLSASETYKIFLSHRGLLAQQLMDLIQDKVGDQVAAGSFGDIWKGLVGHQRVSVKIMRLFRDSDVKAALKEFGREILIWRQLSHPNLLPFFGLYYIETRICLVSPWMDNGHLVEFLKNAPSDLNHLSLILDVSMGLEYLHSRRVVHGDLKGMNILVTPSRRACIADFDVYTFAYVCYEILTGMPPFSELTNDTAVGMRVIGGQRPSKPGVASPAGLWTLLENCWAQISDQRPTMTAILERLVGLSIGAKTTHSEADWDETYSSRFRRSVQQWPLLPSVSEVEHRIFKDELIDGNGDIDYLPPSDTYRNLAPPPPYTSSPSPNPARNPVPSIPHAFPSVSTSGSGRAGAGPPASSNWPATLNWRDLERDEQKPLPTSSSTWSPQDPDPDPQTSDGKTMASPNQRDQQPRGFPSSLKDNSRDSAHTSSLTHPFLIPSAPHQPNNLSFVRPLKPLQRPKRPETWALRPPPKDVYERLEDFFPDHDLDKAVIEAMPGGSHTSMEQTLTPTATAPSNTRAQGLSKKSIRRVAEEQKGHIQEIYQGGKGFTNIQRKLSTKLWDSRIEKLDNSALGDESQATSEGSSECRFSLSPRGLTPLFSNLQMGSWELIAKGSYGRVYLALNATTGELMAVKQVNIPLTDRHREDSRQVTVMEALKLESETLKVLDHPNIVRYLGFEETPATMSVQVFSADATPFMEYVPGGSIGSRLLKHGKFDEGVTKSFTSQILAGLDYLHSKGIIHQDLKSDNILVEMSGVCKISDFGISKRTGYENYAHTSMQGTVYWMAPEVINTQKKGYNSKVDIWGIGCLVLEMWTGTRPWVGDEILSVMFKLFQSKLPPPIPDDLALRPLAEDFRMKCFAINPEERPTAAELRKHPYLTPTPGWVFDGFH